MVWTIKDAIDVARDHIQDVRSDVGGGEFRHSDAKLMRFFNSALSDARKLRPDLFIPNLNTPLPLYTEADLTALTPFPIDHMYFTAVAEYVAGIVGMGDDEFAVDGRAVVLLNRFAQKLTGRGA